MAQEFLMTPRFTPAQSGAAADSVESTDGASSRRASWWPSLIVFMLALLWFGVDVFVPSGAAPKDNPTGDSQRPFKVSFGLDNEPFFPDEVSYLYQSYLGRLYLTGQWQHKDWAHYAAYDSPPLFKHLIALALWVSGEAPPTSIQPADGWWSGNFDPPARPRQLLAARILFWFGSAFAVTSMFWLGRQLIGPMTGILAAGLFACSPVVFTHARRAMADNLAIGLMLAGLVAMVNGLKRSEPLFNRHSIAAGLLLGAAAAMKLTGLMGLMVAGAFFCCLLMIRLARGQSDHYRMGQIIMSGITVALVSVAFFVITNPFLFAQPKEAIAANSNHLPDLVKKDIIARLRFMFEHRRLVNQQGAANFPNDALSSANVRLQTIAKEGLGRWTAASGLPIRIDRDSDLARQHLDAKGQWVLWSQTPINQA